MNLFQDDHYHTFYLPDPKKLPDLTVVFDRFRQTDLAEFWRFVQNHFTLPCRIMGPRNQLPNEGYIPFGKKGQVRKQDLIRFCALVHCCPENIRLTVSLFPESFQNVLRIILRQGCISYSELCRMGIKDLLVKQGQYSWDRWYKGPAASLMLVRESTKEGEENNDYHYERDGYLYLPDFLTGRYAEALVPEMADVRLFHRETADQGLMTVSAEKQFLASFPLIQGIYRQSGIKLNGLKLSAALAGGILAKTAIPEVIPSGLRSIIKINTGQYFLPSLVLSLEEEFGKKVENHVKSAVSLLKRAYAAYAYPALLPHIKGFRNNILQGEVRQEWLSVLGGAFISFPGEWISLAQLCDFIHGMSFEPWAVGYTISPEVLHNMYPVNTITGTAVLPNNQGSEIDLEILRALSLALYGMGAAELAVDLSVEIPDTPCGNIKMIRLTPLGRYAFEIDKEYRVETIESRSYFSLDEKRLIIQSVSGNNPYESLLMDTATPIGGGKFVMSAESFLRNCSTKNDVDEKVKFFEDYVDNNPPQVWKDFFRTIRQRCNPLLPVKGHYTLLQLNPENKPLAALVLGDPEIRPLIIMAEDYRVIVRKEDYDKLCKLLKKHGYLL